MDNNAKIVSNSKMYFEISERRILLRLFDVIFVFLSLYFVQSQFGISYLEFSVSNFYWTVVLGVYLLFFGSIFEMYNLQVASNEFQVLKSTVLTVSTTVLVYLLTPVFSPTLPTTRIQILIFYGIVLISLVLWRLFYVRFLASNRFVQNVILICEKEQLQELILGLQHIDPHYKIIAYVSVDAIEDFVNHDYVQQIEKNSLVSFVEKYGVSEVVVASQKTEGITSELYQQLLQLLESGRSIREYTQVYESKTHRIPVQYMARDFYRFFPFSRSNSNKLYLSVVRFFEVLLSIIGILLGALLLPLVLLGNCIGNRGALMYIQERVGKDGTVFNIYKLRTMVQDAESNGAVFTVANDVRVTRFGSFLRKTRIDEFPQFYNILKGDMAIIGPRPERPCFVNKIAELMPFYETRHVIKPGLSGWAQVNYSYGESIQDSLIKLQYDLYYIKHRSVYLDLNISLRTITTVLFYRGQ